MTTFWRTESLNKQVSHYDFHGRRRWGRTVAKPRRSVKYTSEWCVVRESQKGTPEKRNAYCQLERITIQEGTHIVGNSHDCLWPLWQNTISPPALPCISAKPNNKKDIRCLQKNTLLDPYCPRWKRVGVEMQIMSMIQAVTKTLTMVAAVST